MTVETVTHISDLNASYPAGTDAKAEGDDHIRNIKTALKTDFPNINGVVSASDEDLSACENFEETISATVSEVTIATGKTLNIADDGGLKLNETAVTATAEELNKLDGATITTADLNNLAAGAKGLVILDEPVELVPTSSTRGAWTNVDMSAKYAAAATAGATHAIVRVYGFGGHGLSSAEVFRVSVRKGGSSSATTPTVAVYAYGDTDYLSGSAEVTVALDSNSDFEWYAQQGGTSPSTSVTIYLVGYYIS